VADEFFPEPDLPEAVLAELGRLTLAAVRLEETTYLVCRSIKPRHGPWDDCPIGSHVDEAVSDLATCPKDDMRDRAEAWLKEAEEALASRNAVLHASFVTYVPLPGTTPIPDATGEWLAHFPRNKKRPPVRTLLTTEGLRPIRERLERARKGWMDLATYPWACYPGDKGWKQSH